MKWLKNLALGINPLHCFLLAVLYWSKINYLSNDLNEAVLSNIQLKQIYLWIFFFLCNYGYFLSILNSFYIIYLLKLPISHTSCFFIVINQMLLTFNNKKLYIMICGDCTKLYVVSNQQLLLNHVQRSLNKTNNSLGKLKIGKHKL